MDIKKEAHKILKDNRRQTEDGKYQYTVPSSATYPYQWFWDSCFHAIVLARLEPEAAKAELRSLVSKQFENGMMPHMIYWRPGDLHKYEWGKDGTSAITQPPLLAYAVSSVYERTKDKKFLAEMCGPLRSFHEYLLRERDRRGYHLVSIINPDESGEDNSPRFDLPLGIEDPQISPDEHLKKRVALIDDNRSCNFDARNCMEKFFWVKDVPFNSILIENLCITADLAGILGDAALEKFSRENADLIARSMRESMYKDGFFWPISETGKNKEMIKVNTWAHFAPLFAGIYTKQEAENLVRDELLNEGTFLAKHGIRSVSKKEISYNPEGYWRGSVWPSVHWFIYQGLKKYGFNEEAEMLKEKTTKLIQKEGFREYYNPETGAGLGAEGFTWGTLLLDMD